MLSFELRKYVEGRWVLDTIFDDKTEAVAEAKSLMTRSRSLAAVRVMAVQDDETGFKEWTVYKQTMVDSDNEQATQRAIQTRREARAAQPASRDGPAPPNKAKARKSAASWRYYAGIMARVVVIIGAGAAAIILIHRQFL